MCQLVQPYNTMKLPNLILFITLGLPSIAAEGDFSLLFYVPDDHEDVAVTAKFLNDESPVETRTRNDFVDSKHVCMDEPGDYETSEG